MHAHRPRHAGRHVRPLSRRRRDLRPLLQLNRSMHDHDELSVRRPSARHLGPVGGMDSGPTSRLLRRRAPSRHHACACHSQTYRQLAAALRPARYPPLHASPPPTRHLPSNGPAYRPALGPAHPPRIGTPSVRRARPVRTGQCTEEACVVNQDPRVSYLHRLVGWWVGSRTPPDAHARLPRHVVPRERAPGGPREGGRSAVPPARAVPRYEPA
jgi:hypothetical protein